MYNDHFELKILCVVRKYKSYMCMLYVLQVSRVLNVQHEYHVQHMYHLLHVHCDNIDSFPRLKLRISLDLCTILNCSRL